MARDPEGLSHWWGRQYGGDQRLTLLDLVRNNTLDVESAALLWLLVEGKSSMVAAAAPRLAGKTTLVSALVDFMPPRYTKVYTRGQAEDFSFLAAAVPRDTYILVPELSDHTPAYLWGEGVRTLFKALERGYSVATTIHADTPGQVMAVLAGDPLSVPYSQLHRLDVIVNLRLTYGRRGMVRRVNQITLVAPGPRGQAPKLLTLVVWDSRGDSFVHTQSAEARRMLARCLGMPEGEMDSALAHRIEQLKTWVSGGTVEAGEVQALVAQFYEQPR